MPAPYRRRPRNAATALRAAPASTGRLDSAVAPLCNRFQRWRRSSWGIQGGRALLSEYNPKPWAPEPSGPHNGAPQPIDFLLAPEAPRSPGRPQGQSQGGPREAPGRRHGGPGEAPGTSQGSPGEALVKPKGGPKELEPIASLISFRGSQEPREAFFY